MSEDSVADKIRVISGPTAAGKSSLALRLAEHFGSSIISADSRQVYRGFDIGTAKPSAGEQSRVRHYCIDVAEPTARYSAAAWAECAELAIEHTKRDGLVPLVVGGTGFYLRALFHPLFEEPPVDEARLAQVRVLLNEMKLAELRRWCEVIDPDLAAFGRAQLQRAIEVSILTGERLSVMREGRKRAPARRARYLLLDSGAAHVDAISGRVHAMFSSGWEDEVRELVARVPEDAPAWKATGYRDVRELVVGNINRNEAVNRITTGTRQYAKRQRTWLRHQLEDEDVTVLDASDPALLERAMNWWEGNNR